MKEWICAAMGVLGSGIAAVFGGWDGAMVTLVLFMGVDYLTGMLVAGVFHNSPKTEGGRLESRAGWKGLIRKGAVLLVVLVAWRLDLLVGSEHFFRDAAVIAFVVNEGLSILENIALMGVRVPPVVRRALEVLRKKGEELSDDDGEEAPHDPE